MKKRKDNSNYKADFNQALAIAVNELNVSKNDIIAALTDDNVEITERKNQSLSGQIWTFGYSPRHLRPTLDHH